MEGHRDRAQGMEEGSNGLRGWMDYGKGLRGWIDGQMDGGRREGEGSGDGWTEGEGSLWMGWDSRDRGMKGKGSGDGGRKERA